jgi:peptidoglycan/LPS O-acetylase OafA/YrhL
MAMVIEEKWLTRTVSAVGRRGGLVVACILALLALSHRQVNLGETFYGVVAWRLCEALLIGGAILLIVMHPAKGLARFLESRPLVFVGTLSYSLYLFQQPFTNDESGTWWCRWPINMALIPIAALLSYFCIERPFLLLKRPQSPGRSLTSWRGFFHEHTRLR